MEHRTEGETLLAHLAWKLSSRHEDIAVEALGFILKSDSTLRAIEGVLEDGGADVGKIARIQTQVSGDGETRPDLVGFDQHDVECVLIEAKFWAGLTANQPNAYLDRLAPGKALLFVAPESRLETLWPELRRRADSDRLLSILDRTSLKSAATDDGKHLMMISWADLLDRLQGAADSSSRNEIRQLRGLVHRVDDESGYPPLRPEELAPEIPRRLLSLERLIGDATARAVEQGYADIKGLNVTPYPGGYGRPRGYGRYLSLKGAIAWFGIGLNWWVRGGYSDTPLWLSFGLSKDEGYRARWPDTSRALEPLKRRDPPECLEENQALLVPIALPTGVEYDAVLDAVVERLREIADLIDKHRT